MDLLYIWTEVIIALCYPMKCYEVILTSLESDTVIVAPVEETNTEKYDEIQP